MAYDEIVNEKIVQNFELLCSIIKQHTSINELRVDLGKVEEIINKRIPDVLKEDAPDDFYDLYIDFKHQYEKFRDFILYDELIGKNIVALGGGFSSGKSSFLNTLMKQHPLPENIDPSTSVPTYIVYGENYKTTGINTFNTKITMPDFRDIKRIAHNFGEIKDEDGNVIYSNNVTLGHILDSIFLATPKHEYKNIAFLDTPGYSKPDSEKYSAKTDEQISRGQLNSSNYILWFVQAEAGTITEDDIRFIKTLRCDIPILIVLNKADMKTEKELRDIITKIRDTLDVKGIPYIDVLAFSSKINSAVDDVAEKFILDDMEKIRKQISDWNKQVYESNFASNFKVLFIRCLQFYNEKLSDRRYNLGKLNALLTRSERQEDIEIIETMVNECKNKIEELSQMVDKLKNIQYEFFNEIKKIADIVQIEMPEPSKMELMDIKDISVENLLKFQYAGSEIEGFFRESITHENMLAKEFGGLYYENSVISILRGEEV